MTTHRGLVSALTLIVALAGCGSTPTATGPATSVAPTATTAAVTATAPATARPTRTPTPFPIAVFTGLGDEPVSDALAAELQQVLEMSARGEGLTAAVISPQGTWNGTTGMATAERAMVPNDQMAIASITKTLVAAQVMQLVEAGELGLDDLAADRLSPDLDFELNGETIANLPSHRSGFRSDTMLDPVDAESITTDPTHAWTIEELLGTIGPERGPVSQAFEYRGITYVLLGLIVEHVTGRPLAEVLRGGVLDGKGYERLIYQPAERPTDPMAMPSGASADTFDEVGGFLPSLAAATAFNSEGAMASDSLSLARWFRRLCAGEVVSPASLSEMADFGKRPEYGLGLIDRRGEYGGSSGALGHTGHLPGFTTVALCFQNPGIVVVVLANADEHDVDTTAGALWRAAST